MRDPKQANSATSSILDEFREARSFFYKIWGPVLLISLVGFAIAWFFVEPAPPRVLRIAAGPSDGSYFAFAQAYAKSFLKNGIRLEVIETAGSLENYDLLLAENDVHLAIVQGGTKPKDIDEKQLESIASLYLEPLWIFSRGDKPLADIRELTELRTDSGSPGSGTTAIIRLLLQANGLVEAGNGGALLPGWQQLGGEKSASMLLDSEIDAACFVLSARHPLPARLMDNPDVHLMPFLRNRAYSQIFPFLSDVSLPRGVLDLQKDNPRQNTPLIAPPANLVCSPELHDAFVPLLIHAATISHSQGSLLVESDRFPSLEFAEFSPNTAALDYYQSGPPFLNRVLPFWLASLLTRGKILLLPLVTLLFPLFKIAPPVYRWRIRSRIYRWYLLLRELDLELQERTPANAAEYERALEAMESELKAVKVPLSYMAEFFNLRLHIDLMKRRLANRVDEDQARSNELESCETGERSS